MGASAVTCRSCGGTEFDHVSKQTPCPRFVPMFVSIDDPPVGGPSPVRGHTQTYNGIGMTTSPYPHPPGGSYPIAQGIVNVPTQGQTKSLYQKLFGAGGLPDPADAIVKPVMEAQQSTADELRAIRQWGDDMNRRMTMLLDANEKQDKLISQLQTRIDNFEKANYQKLGGKLVPKDPIDYVEMHDSDEDGLEVGYNGWPKVSKYRDHNS